MDEQLGVLFDFIRIKPDLQANTLILLCSDNGHEHGAGRSDPLRGAKTWLYEGGIRSPLIVWGPGLLPSGAAGVVDHESVFCALDLNRSLYAITDTPLPHGFQLDGEDVSAALLGRGREGRQAPICFRRPPDRPGYGHGYPEDNPDLAIRAGRWKLLVNQDGSEPQLYDLERDSSESTNRIAEKPEIAKRLQELVFQWNRGLPPDAGVPEHTLASP
jgi:uncharacterized sulfatase